MPVEPTATSFRDWSRHAATKPLIWPSPRPQQTTIITRLIPAVFGTCRVSITDGDPHASIGANRADIRFPQPFDENGLTDACRAFIITAAREALRADGLKRWITWPDRSVTAVTDAR